MNNDREPKNLQAFLKFCLSTDDGKGLKEIDPQEAKEKGEWLSKVLNEISVNIGQQIVDNINVLLRVIDNETLGDDDETEQAFEELQDIVENVDYARNFIKIGGLKVLKKLLELDNESLNGKAAELLGLVAQNDEALQLAIFEMKFIKLILDKISSSTKGLAVKRMVFGLSCCIRSFAKGVEEFLAEGGVKVILNAMNIGEGECKMKSIFMLSCLERDLDEGVSSIVTRDQFKDLLIMLRKENGNCEQDCALMEYLLNLIVTLLKKNKSWTSLIDTVTSNLVREEVLRTAGRDEILELHQYWLQMEAML